MYRIKLATVVATVIALVLSTISPAFAATAPSAPPKPTVTVSDKKASVTWTAPSDNGSPILDYTVTSNPGNNTCTTVSLTCEVTGLSNETSYSFSVTARNAMGISPASTNSISYAPSHTPLTLGTGNLGTGNIVAAHSSISSAHIFVVSSKANETTKILKLSEVTNEVVETTNLGIFTSRYVSSFVDAQGEYLYLFFENSTVIKFALTTMSLAQNTSFFATTGRIRGAQKNPAGTEALLDIDNFATYRARVRLSDLTYLGSGNISNTGPYVVNSDNTEAYVSFVQGGSYSCCTYEIRKYNAQTGSIISRVSAGIGSEAREAFFRNSEGTAYFVYNNRIVKYFPAPNTYQATNLYTTDSIIDNEENYIYGLSGGGAISKISLQTMNIVGSSAFDSSGIPAPGAMSISSDGTELLVFSSDATGKFSRLALADIASSPTSLSVASRGLNQVTLSWSPPTNAAGLVEDYKIEYSTDGASWVTFQDGQSDIPQATVTGLLTGTSYWFRVSGVSPGGDGLKSEVLTEVKSAVVPTMSQPTFTSTRTQVQPSWAVSDNGGLAPSNFELQKQEEDLTWSTIYTGSATTFSVTDLIPGKAYSFRVRAQNTVGWSAYSTGSFSTVALGSPTGLKITNRGLADVALRWTGVTVESNLVDGYQVEYSTNVNGTGPWTIAANLSSSARTMVVTGLDAGRRYVFRVAATGHGGISPYALIQSFDSKVVTGLNHSCVLTSSKNVRCWGSINSYGQLGNGNTSPDNLGLLNLADLYDVADLSATYNHTCAVRSNGKIVCWGSNSSGQLGDGTTTNRWRPTEVVGIDNAVQVAAGIDRTCATLSTGQAKCWGAGMLGDGGNSGSLTPVVVSGLSLVQEVTAGLGMSCSKSSGPVVDGIVHCWGSDLSGALGNGSLASSTTPIQISSFANDISTYGNTTCEIVGSDTRVYCWGQQVGSNSPTQLSTGFMVPTQISVGLGHICFVTNSFGGVCRGDNGSGQLGDGSITNRTSFASTSLSAKFTSISAGAEHTCGITYSYYVNQVLTYGAKTICWGANTGQTYPNLTQQALGISMSPMRVPTLEAIQVIGQTRTSLTWKFNVFDSDTLPIDSYESYVSTDGTNWSDLVQSASATRTLDNLLPGTNYYIKSRAHSATGWSSFVTTSTSTTELAPPRSLAVSDRRIGEVSLTWQAPSEDAQLVDDYIVEYSNDGLTWVTVTDSVTATTGIDITNLTTGQNYFVRVKSLDRSVFSQPIMISSVKSAETPSIGAPVIGISRTSVTASWTATNTGGLSISGYEVQLSIDGSNWQEPVVVTGTSHTFSNLLPGTRYYVRVSGTNALGTGSPSVATSNVTTDLAPPSAVSVTSRGVNRISISWSAPSSQPELVDDYKIEYSSNNLTWTTFTHAASTATTATITGLTKGTNYYVRVSAVDRTVFSATAALSGTTTPAVEPTVAAPTMTVTRTSVAASWSVSNTGGMSVTNYEVQLSADGSNWQSPVSQAGTSKTFTGLVPGATYYVRVRAQNDVGYGAYSTTSQISTTPLDVPVNIHQQSRGTGSVTLAWDQPNGNPELVTDYVVEYSADSGATWATVSDGVSTTTSATISGLTSGTAYAFRVTSKAGTALSSSAYPAMSNLTSIAAGTNSTCALTVAKTVYCWGQNSYGQLGDGTTTTANAPKVVPGLRNVVGLDLDAQHVCAVTGTGTVYCWGTNASGQAGVTGGASVLTPTQVPGITTATKVTVGASHSCALLTGGSVVCWGSNSAGQLGNGSTLSSVSPVAVTGLTGALSIDAGGSTTCAVTSTRSLSCWGSGSSYQIGNGSSLNKTSPVSATGLSTVRSVSVGTSHTCITKQNNELWCWGVNSSGKLGDGTTTTRTTPVLISGLSVSSVAAGGTSTCAVTTSGTEYCWGLNSTGQVGIGNTNNSLVPAAINVPGTPIISSVGASHSCSVSTDGTAACWGSSASSQLGTAPSSNNLIPKYVLAVYQVVGAPVMSSLAVSDTGRTSTNVSWSVLDDGGSDITGYQVQYSLDGGTTWGPVQEIPVGSGYSPNSLVPGQAYRIKVRAQNGVGFGEYETASFTTNRLAPARNLHLVTRTLNSVSIAWDAPQEESSLVTDYLVEYSSNNGTSWTTFSDGVSTATTATVSGLTNGTAYLLRVTAKAGSATSDSVVVTNPAQNTPIGMQIALSSPTTSSIRVDWSGVNSGVDPVTRYVFETSVDGTTWVRHSEIAITGTDPGFGFKNLTGLTSGKWYYVRAAAENIAGLGPWSNIERAATSGYGRMTLNVTDFGGNALKLGSYSWHAIDYSVASTGSVLSSARGVVVFERVYPKSGVINVSNAVAGRDILVSGSWVAAIGTGTQSLSVPVATPTVSNYSVRVVLPNGLPVPNATVNISGLSSSVDLGNFNFTYQKAVTRGVTDQTGRVVVSGFVTGPVQATIVYEDPYLTQIKYGVALTASSQDIQLDYMPYIQTPRSRLQASAGALVSIPVTYSDPNAVIASVGSSSIIASLLASNTVDGQVSVTPPANAPQDCGGAVLSAPIINGVATLQVCASGSGEYVLSSTGAVSLGAVTIEAAGTPPSIVPSLSLSSSSDNSVTATWGLPDFDGGSAITGYRIEAVSGDRAMTWNLTDSTTISTRQALLTGLSSDLEWTISVRAINSSGVGSAASGTIIIAGVVIAVSATELSSVTPTISGEARISQTLTAASGSWGPSPVAISYQWNRNGYAIAGATNSTYTLTQTDFAASITVTVTGAKDGFRTTSLTSAAVGPVIALHVPTVVENLSTGDGRNRNFVRVLYKDFLNRDATEGEVSYWAGELNSGRISQGALTTNLSRSDEWVQAVIRSFYLDTLGREPDAAGYQYWIGRARSGMPIADIGSFFYGSDEYFQTTGQSNYTVWIGDLYQKLMLRGGDPGGIAYWVGRLNAGMSRPAVAHWFYQSPEKLGLRVDSLYSKLLNRGSDPGGRAYWAGRLYGEGDLALASQLASSPEYYGRQFLR